MITYFQDREFRSFRDRDSARVFADFHFRSCRFVSCVISITRSSKLRTTIRNVCIESCSQLGCSIQNAIVEDTVVDGLATAGQLFQTWGAVFSRVVLSGRIDRIMISPTVMPGVATEGEQREFDTANEAFYAGVDWALDLSKCEFSECDIQGIPIRLIRRDPDTQAVVSRASLLDGRWKRIKTRSPIWKIMFSRLLHSAEEGVLIVAPKRHPQFDDLLRDVNHLRRLSIADRD